MMNTKTKTKAKKKASNNKNKNTSHAIARVKSSAPAEDSLLTPREKQIVKLLGDGCTSKEAAKRLKISMRTVDAHRANVMRKLHIHNLAGLVKYALKTGLITLGD